MWNKTFKAQESGPQNNVDARTIIEDSGSYLFAGNWAHNPCLINLDLNGNTMWTQTYNLGQNCHFNEYTVFSITKAVDSGYLLAGGNWLSSFLIKTSQQGVMEWNTTSLKNSNFNSVVQAPDVKGYIAVGGSTDPRMPNAFIAKFDSNGKILSVWNSSETSQLFSSENYAQSIIQTSDGSYAVTGAQNSTVWLSKFTPEAQSTPEITENTNSTFTVMAITAFIITVVILGAFAVRYRKSTSKSNM
jgi:hypothetical protein